MARLRICEGDYIAARSYLLEAFKHGGRNPPPDLLRLLSDAMAQLNSFAAGAELMEKSLDAYRVTGDRCGESIAAADLAAFLQRQGNLGRARGLVEWALTNIDPGNTYQVGRILNIAATIATFQGRLDEALAYLIEAKPLAKGRVSYWVSLNLSVVLDNLCRPTEARRALRDAEALFSTDDTYTPLLYSYALAWHLILQDQYDQAYLVCQKAIHRMDPNQHPIVFYPILATIGVLAGQIGDLEEAEGLLVYALNALENHSDQAAVIGICWHLASVARKRKDDGAAASWILRALRGMQVGGFGLTLLWQPREVIKLCMWSINENVEKLQSTWLLQTTLVSWFDQSPPDESIALPIQCSQSPIADPHSLTARERQVVSLVALGMRDAEIAKQLHISVRTVQNHLQHCFDKLGVRSRVGAIKAVRQEGLISDRSDSSDIV